MTNTQATTPELGELLNCPFCGNSVEIADVPTAAAPIIHHPPYDRHCALSDKFILASAWNTRLSRPVGDDVVECKKDWNNGVNYGLQAAHLAARGTNSDLCKSASAAYQNILDCLKKLTAENIPDCYRPAALSSIPVSTEPEEVDPRFDPTHPLHDVVCGWCGKVHPSGSTGDAEPSADAVERLRDAYLAGATDVHDAWVSGNGQSKADFGEAASDYVAALSAAIPTASEPSDGEIYSLASFGGDHAAKDAFIAEIMPATEPSGEEQAAHDIHVAVAAELVKRGYRQFDLTLGDNPGEYEANWRIVTATEPSGEVVQADREPDAWLIERLAGDGYGSARRIVDAQKYDPTLPGFWVENAREHHRVTPLYSGLAHSGVGNVVALKAALQRTTEHLRSFADYYPDDRTTETDAIFWCNNQLLSALSTTEPVELQTDRSASTPGAKPEDRHEAKPRA